MAGKRKPTRPVTDALPCDRLHSHMARGERCRCGFTAEPLEGEYTTGYPGRDPFAGAFDSTPERRPYATHHPTHPDRAKPGPGGAGRIPPALLPVKPRTSEQLAGVPLSKWTDHEVANYIAFVLETAAHLAGGFGALQPNTCLGLGARLREIGAAHAVNVRTATNWSAGPRVPE